MMDDYSKCKADPSADDFVDRFKQLHSDFREPFFLSKVPRKSILTYIVLTYDIHSPYVIKYKDWVLRRRETAKASGFKIYYGKYLEDVENIILGKTDATNKIIVRYLFLQNDMEFVKLQSYQSLYYGQIVSSMNPAGLKPMDSAKLRSNIEELSVEIKVLEKAIFYGNETKDMLLALYNFVGNITYNFRPEEIAEKKGKGEEIVDESPYKDKYKPEKLGFLDNE